MRTEQSLEDLTITINQEIQVHAPLDITSAALLEQLGPGNQTPDGKSLNMNPKAYPHNKKGDRAFRPAALIPISNLDLRKNILHLRK